MTPTPVTRRVWTIPKAGSLNRLRLVDQDLAPPGKGQVQVRVRAAGLNFADIFACLGLYSATPKGAFTPGLEFAGEVESLGPGQPAEPAWEPGDRIMGVIRFGAFADRLTADARYLRPLPDGWSFEEGASFGVQMLTAWYALVELGAVKEGQTVLVHSAAGGVGLNALKILEKKGAQLVATIGRGSKRGLLAGRFALGPNQIIVRDRKKFARQLEDALQSLGRPGFDIILDSVAGPFFWPGYRRLQPAGRLVIYGAADLMPPGRRPNYLSLAWRYLRRPRLDALQMITDNRSVMGFNLIWLWDQVSVMSEAFRQIEQAGLLDEPPHVGKVFPLPQALPALRLLQSGKSVGKVVLSA